MYSYFGWEWQGECDTSPTEYSNQQKHSLNQSILSPHYSIYQIQCIPRDSFQQLSHLYPITFEHMLLFNPHQNPNMASLIDLISPEYGLVLLVAVILGFEVVLFGFLFPGRLRRSIFSKEFMKQNFGKIHANEVKGEIKAEGYPDMGNGRYSEKLTYANWLKFNSAQRVHINFVESISTYLILLLVGGLYNPLLAAGFGAAIVVGRLIYGIGYVFSPALRVPGGLINAVSLLGLTVLSGLAAYSIVSKKKWL